MEKIVSQLDAAGYLTGSAVADESPLEPGVFLIPGGCVDVEPPVVPSGKRAKFVDGGFLLEDIPPPTQPPAPEPLTPEQIEAQITAEVRRRLEDWARQREYDSIVSLCSYAGDPDPTLNAEGTLGILKRSETWVTMKRIRADVLAGNWPTAGAGQMPTSIADIEADLPPLVWPA